jgi:hypothetical protein
MPFAIMPGSGFFLRHMTQNMPITASNAPAIAVFTATTVKRRSVAAVRDRQPQRRGDRLTACGSAQPAESSEETAGAPCNLVRS